MTDNTTKIKTHIAAAQVFAPAKESHEFIICWESRDKYSCVMKRHINQDVRTNEDIPFTLFKRVENAKR